MNYWLVYHSYKKMGYLPGFDDAEDFAWDVKSQSLADFSAKSDKKRAAVLTRRRGILDAVGDVAFIIVGVKEMRQSSTSYYLWNWILLDAVEDGADCYLGSGKIWHRFCPPILLEGEGFDAFKQSTANFAQGMVEISSKPFCTDVLSKEYERTAK